MTKMPGALDKLHAAELYAGDDLENAYVRSFGGTAAGEAGADTPCPPRVPYALHVPRPLGALRWPRALGELIRDVSKTDSLALWPRSCLVTGTERTSGTTMRILFRGRLKSVDFVARHVLGTDDYERAAADPSAACDVHVADHPLVDRHLLGARAALHVPPWVRQRCAVGETWAQTLALIPRALRKEISRLLRRQRYDVRLDAGAEAKAEFYETLYVPFVRRRFGANAIDAGRRAYDREARDAVLLSVHAGDARLGASLVSRAGDTLLIRKTAPAEANAAPSEVLDYFCLLLAQHLGCSWLDLGVARPHLDDGVFGYKAKWRPWLVPPGPAKSAIRIRPLQASRATLGFLSRNGFIERRGGSWLVRRLPGAGRSGARDIEQAAALAQRRGIDGVVFARDPLGAFLRGV